MNNPETAPAAPEYFAPLETTAQLPDVAALNGTPNEQAGQLSALAEAEIARKIEAGLHTLPA